MSDFQRILDLNSLLEKKSHFLFGPRSTGKSSLVCQQLSSNALIINLLRHDNYLRLTERPALLEDLIEQNLGEKKYVVIDEIQKVPPLLDEVHRLIEEKKIRFLLTGSSARKLKRGHSNLLAGRAWSAELFPITTKEVPDFKLDAYLRFGGLPQVMTSKHPDEELYSYVNTYLYEEIQAEGIVRKIPQFSRFLKTAALSNGQMLNYASIGSDAGMALSTVREYFQILEDTLIGFQVCGWNESKKRKAITTSKFFFFDTGVTHTLSGTRSLDRNSDLYGKSFEQFIGMELRAYLSYKRIREKLCYWRSTSKQEVDFVIGDEIAMEVKATTKVTAKNLVGLKALEEEKMIKKLVLVTQDKFETRQKNIQCLHWKTFLNRLWAGDIF